MARLLGVLVFVATATTAFAAPGATVQVFDIQSTDVPGPQPIRAFPVPAAAGMAGAQLIYDNAARLGFSSASSTSPNWVSFPLVSPGVTINALEYDYNSTVPTKVNNTLSYFTNTEDMPADNRFPAHIPRPGRFAGEDYTAVQFDLAQAAPDFGVFVAMNCDWYTGTWSNWNKADNNNAVMHGDYDSHRFLDVFVLGETDTFATARHLQFDVYHMYAPFFRVTADQGGPLIKAVCIVQNAAIETGAPFGFFDVYVTPEPASLMLIAVGTCWVLARGRAATTRRGFA